MLCGSIFPYTLLPSSPLTEKLFLSYVTSILHTFQRVISFPFPSHNIFYVFRTLIKLHKKKNPAILATVMIKSREAAVSSTWKDSFPTSLNKLISCFAKSKLRKLNCMLNKLSILLKMRQHLHVLPHVSDVLNRTKTRSLHHETLSDDPERDDAPGLR